MNISAFQLLSRNEQITEIYTQGVFIAKQTSTHFHIKVYFQLYGFYIQVCYESYRKYIIHLSVSDNVKFVEHLLPDVNIEEIIDYITSHNTIK